MKRNVYLEMKTLEEAQEILFKKFPGKIILEESIRVEDSVDRVIARPVTAKVSSPCFHAAAMDGIAVKADKTFGANQTSPMELIIGVDASYINTGHLIPDEFDAVIMIESVNVIDDDKLEIEAPAFPFQYVRKMGEDIVATELLFPQGHIITPYCVGALISGGVFSVSVKKKPKLLIIPTGSELVDWRGFDVGNLKAGQVLESNSFVLSGLAEKCGAEYKRNQLITDDMEIISDTVVNASRNDDYDIIIIIGGSSAGSEDYAKAVISREGDVFVHGVTIMPGKPLLFGSVNNKPVFGIPGYPVSAIVAFEQFVKPLIHHMASSYEYKRMKIDVEPARKINSKLGSEEFLRVKIGKVGSRIIATPLPGGAGSITSITEADGIIRIPTHVEGLNSNELVKAELLTPLSQIEDTIVVVGSHDNTLDVLADQIRADSRKSSLTLSSSHVGSMGGLLALKKGLCHIAGTHLLDGTDGSYNISYINKYLAGKKVRLVNLVLREQGLIVQRGNPKKIKSIEDLVRDDIKFINRQAGSGTRILLDYKLGKLGIDNNIIDGYGTDEYTHMSVAAAVLSGVADTGLGIYAAAKALELDFIPVVTEQYDLVIDESCCGSDKINILLETINSENFKRRVLTLGGYSTEKTGEMISLNGNN